MGERRENRKKFHKEQEKKLRRLNRELQELRRAQWNLGWIELEKPIQSGFERVVVPRPDYMRRKDAAYFIELADFVNSTVTSRDKKFIRKNWSTGVKEEVHAKPREIRDFEWEKVPEKFKAEFHKEERQGHSWGAFTSTYTVYVLDKQWRFTEKMQKHYITRVQLRDPELESRITEIDDYLERNNLYEKLWHYQGGSRKSYWDDSWERQVDEAQKKVILSEANKEALDYSLENYWTFDR